MRLSRRVEHQSSECGEKGEKRRGKMQQSACFLSFPIRFASEILLLCIPGPIKLFRPENGERRVETEKKGGRVYLRDGESGEDRGSERWWSTFYPRVLPPPSETGAGTGSWRRKGRGGRCSFYIYVEEEERGREEIAIESSPGFGIWQANSLRFPSRGRPERSLLTPTYTSCCYIWS